MSYYKYQSNPAIQQNFKKVSIEWHHLCQTVDDAFKVSTHWLFRATMIPKAFVTMGHSARMEAEKINNMANTVERSLTSIANTLDQSIQIAKDSDEDFNLYALNTFLKTKQKQLEYKDEVLEVIPVQTHTQQWLGQHIRNERSSLYETVLHENKWTLSRLLFLVHQKGFSPEAIAGIKEAFIEKSIDRYLGKHRELLRFGIWTSHEENGVKTMHGIFDDSTWHLNLTE